MILVGTVSACIVAAVTVPIQITANWTIPAIQVVLVLSNVSSCAIALILLVTLIVFPRARFAQNGTVHVSLLCALFSLMSVVFFAANLPINTDLINIAFYLGQTMLYVLWAVLLKHPRTIPPYRPMSPERFERLQQWEDELQYLPMA